LLLQVFTAPGTNDRNFTGTWKRENVACAGLAGVRPVAAHLLTNATEMKVIGTGYAEFL
jgi:hypothetical protein